MKPEIVKWFNQWFLENEEWIKQKGLKITYAEKSEKYPQYFQWVDIDSTKNLGNVIIYDIGTCDTQTINLKTNESSSTASIINSENELKELLEKYVLSL